MVIIILNFNADDRIYSFATQPKGRLTIAGAVGKMSNLGLKQDSGAPRSYTLCARGSRCRHMCTQPPSLQQFRVHQGIGHIQHHPL